MIISTKIGFEILDQMDWKDIKVNDIQIFMDVKSNAATSHILRL